jgi:beta-galactosidase/beta-glucuronidase
MVRRNYANFHTFYRKKMIKKNNSFLFFHLVFWGILMFADNTTAQITPRAEYPRPQFERSEWKNLNGEWSYTFDFSKTGIERGYKSSSGFDQKIIVPFCPESKLSGVGHTDFIETMWYHRKMDLPASWKNRKVILHFGAVDYQSELLIDGNVVGTHFGGTSSFSWDITNFVSPGKSQNLVLLVTDNTRSGKQPVGKQSGSLRSWGGVYTRTTGIWQTVWLEPVAAKGLKDCHITPDFDRNRFIFQPQFYGLENGMNFKITILDKGKVVAQQSIPASNSTSLELAIKNPKTWSPESPFLYDICYQVLDKNNSVIDEVKSYAGMRKVHIEGNRIYLNNKPIYLRLVLDQGFYPDGIWTAPTDAALKNDIRLSMDAGFNGARLHQKVFEERFHYWADKLGYLTWGESASWGCNTTDVEAGRNFLSEWEDVVERDRNHPSIITWTPFNETGIRKNHPIHYDRLVYDVYNATKRIDPTRPINDASGYYHIKTDLYSSHVYEQDPLKLKEMLAPNEKSPVFVNNYDQTQYEGQPFILDEYGGVRLISKTIPEDGYWYYEQAPSTEDEFVTRLTQLTDAILFYPSISGYCYTQLFDVEQEKNGIYNYDRTLKFDMAKIRKVFNRVPESFK